MKSKDNSFFFLVGHQLTFPALYIKQVLIEHYTQIGRSPLVFLFSGISKQYSGIKGIFLVIYLLRVI